MIDKVRAADGAASAVARRPATAAPDPSGGPNTPDASREPSTPDAPAAANDQPFFIVGCVRSGTTLLRDLLRAHPRLECPEETHFFRWPDPYGTPRYQRASEQSKVLEKHREIDGVDGGSFRLACQRAMSRRQLADWYGREYLRTCGNPDGRWFDKTPQNVYGLLLLSGMYPGARFVHIHRDPLNVVASLKEGRVMPVQPLVGAINYWYEAMLIIDQYKRLAPERLHQIAYESLVTTPEATLRELLLFLDEDPSQLDYACIRTYPERNKYRTLLDAEEIELVRTMTEPFRSRYGYA